MQLKTCTKCGLEKPITEFYKEKYNHTCKECRRNYYKQNKERITSIQKKYRQTHKEQRVEYQREYRKTQNYKDMYNRYYKKNAEKILTKTKEYTQKNRHIYQLAESKRRAKRKMLKEYYSNQDYYYTLELFNNQCANCGSTDKLCIDHHNPLSSGHPLSRDNAVLLCTSCNCRKHAKPPEEFYDKEKLLWIESKLQQVK